MKWNEMKAIFILGYKVTPLDTRTLKHAWGYRIPYDWIKKDPSHMKVNIKVVVLLA